MEDAIIATAADSDKIGRSRLGGGEEGVSGMDTSVKETARPPWSRQAPHCHDKMEHRPAKGKQKQTLLLLHQAQTDLSGWAKIDRAPTSVR